MGGDDYSRGKRALKVAERLDVEIADPGAEARIALACRWPEGDAPKAFVIFCHGLGSNGREYAELSRFWASQGYFVAHPTFPDSAHAVAAAEPELGVDPGDAAIASWTKIPALRARLYEILHTPHYWLERIRIVRRVMDALPAVIAECRGASLSELPPGAIAGHSFGAYTAQLFAAPRSTCPSRARASSRTTGSGRRSCSAPRGATSKGCGKARGTACAARSST